MINAQNKETGFKVTIWEATMFNPCKTCPDRLHQAEGRGIRLVLTVISVTIGLARLVRD